MMFKTINLNTNVDHKDVRYALIQAYFNLSNYSNAAKQLDILVPANAPHPECGNQF